MNETPIDLVSAALVECQGELKAAEFDSNNPFFNSKYASLGSVIEASRPSLFKHGLAILQVPTITNREVTVTTEIIHKSGQKLSGGSMTLSLPPLDEQPDDDPEWKKKKRQSDAQLAGSIITYLKRYAWASVLGIYADFDDDGNSAPQSSAKRPVNQPATSTRPTAQNAPQSHQSTQTGHPVVTEKHRMKALNVLQAAPGQPNRTMITHYLMSRGWISGTQEPEAWPLSEVPASAEDMAKLVEAVSRFEAESKGAAQ